MIIYQYLKLFYSRLEKIFIKKKIDWWLIVINLIELTTIIIKTRITKKIIIDKKVDKINVTSIQNKCFEYCNSFNLYQVIIITNNDINLIVNNIKIEDYNFLKLKINLNYII